MGKGGKGLIWMAALLLVATGAMAALAQGRIAVAQVPRHYLRLHDSADDVVFRLASRVDKDPNALYAISQAMSLCTPMLRDWVRRRGMAPTDRAYWRWQSSYCHFGRATQAYWYGHGVLVDMRGRHPGWDFSRGHEASYAQALYASVLRDAPAPDLRTASFELTYEPYGRVPWRYGRDTVAKARHPERLPAYQRMAVRLVECDLMGGCERNGMVAFELCNEEKDCRSGVSVSDILHERFEPDEVAIIETLHRRITDERASYVRTHAAARTLRPLPANRRLYGYESDFNHWQARWSARRLARISHRRSHAMPAATSPRGAPASTRSR